MPNDHTSDWVENTRSTIDSMAIHLTGKGPFNGFKKKKYIKFNGLNQNGKPPFGSFLFEDNLYVPLPSFYSFQNDRLRALDRNRLFSLYCCQPGEYCARPSLREESINKASDVDYCHSVRLFLLQLGFG